ncbi:MAG: hypothetical protein Q8R40_04345 [bacterium]|nr:hypothetical protein [bacterium]
MSAKTVVGITVLLLAILAGVGLLSNIFDGHKAANEDIKIYQTVLLEAKGHYDSLEKDRAYLESIGKTGWVPRIVDQQKTILTKMREWATFIPGHIPIETQHLLRRNS